MSKIIYTIGTSNRSIEEFIEIFKKYQINTAIDVRSFPKSKKFPHFNSENLKQALEKEGIRYVYLGDKLGGFRKGGYENYTKTEEFINGIENLEEIGKAENSVFFCAEKQFFRCHRRFISEALFERCWKVIHIVEKGKTYEHKRFSLAQQSFDFR